MRTQKIQRGYVYASSRRMYKRTACVIALTLLLNGLIVPTKAFAASSWNPTLLVNTEAFQVIEDANTTANVTLRFGATISEELFWDRTNTRFQFTDDVHIEGNLTVTGSLITDGAISTKSNLNVNSDNGAADAVITYGSDGTPETSTFKNNEDRFEFSDDLNVTGGLYASGALIIGGAGSVKGDLTLNSDNGAANAVLTFGSDGTAETATFKNNEDRFEFSDDVHATGNITATGTLITDGAMATKANLEINSDNGAANTVLTFGSDTNDETLTFVNLEDRFEFSDDLHVTGGLYASGALIIGGAGSIKGDATINSDRTAADTVLTFGSDTTNETLTFKNNEDRFEFSDDLNVTGGLYASGALSIGGAGTIKGNLAINSDQTDGDTVLTFGSDDTNETITFDDANDKFVISDDVQVTDSLQIDGNTTLGSDSADTITFNGYVNSSILPSADETYDLGGSSNRWATIYGRTGDFADDLAINNDADAANAILTFGNDSGSETLTFMDIEERFQFSDDLHVEGNLTASGGLVVDGSAVMKTHLRISKLATGTKATLFSVDQMALSQLEGGGYFGRIGLKESQWSVDRVGHTWEPRDSARDWTGIAISSDGKYQTATVTSGTLYVSSNFGMTWTSKSSTKFWQDVSMSSDGKVQTAVDGIGGIYVSADYGQTWASKADYDSFVEVAVSSDGKYQTAVSTVDGAYISSNFGETWTNAGTANVRGVAMSSDGRIQAIVENSATGFIYISYDYGVTWTQKASSTGWRAIAMSSDGKHMTAPTSTTDNIYVSHDYGETWTARDSGRIWTSIAMSSDGKYQTAGVSVGSLYTSSDYGETWTARDTTRAWADFAMSSDGKIQASVVGSSGLIYTSYADSVSYGLVEAIGTMSGRSVHAQDDLRSSGTLVVEGATRLNSTTHIVSTLTTDANATINNDQTAADAVFTFGSDSTNETLTFKNNEDRFEFSDDLHVTGGLYATGALIIGGAGTIKGDFTINSDQTAANTVLTFGSDTTNETVTWTNTADRWDFSDDIRTTGDIYASGALIVTSASRFKADLSINSDQTAADTVLTFGSDTTNETLTFKNNEDRFEFSDDLNVTGGLYATGALIIGGAGSVKGDLTLNSDNGAANAVLTFGSDGTAETATFLNAADRFEFSDDLAVTGNLTSSGTFSLKKYSGTSTGNILMVDTNGLVYDASNKRLGMGTTSPETTIHLVQPGATKIGLAGIFALNNDSLAPGAVMIPMSTDDASATNEYFFAMRTEEDTTPDNEFLFKTDGNAHADVAFTGGGADMAEYFLTSQPNLPKGTIMMIDRTQAKKVRAAKRGSGALIGVISTSPGLIANGGDAEIGHDRGMDPNFAIVGLVGQIPTRVNTENGPIAIGDGISISSVEGVGRKAKDGEPIVGVAQEAYSGVGEGLIDVYVGNMAPLNLEAAIDRAVEKKLKVLIESLGLFKKNNATQEAASARRAERQFQP